jgi:hypothetical protein
VLKAAIRAPVAIAGALGAARVTPGMRVSLKAYADQMAVALVRETHGAAPLRLQAEEATRHGLQQMIEPLLVASPSIRAAWVPAMVYASVQLAELGQRLVPAARLATLALRPESDFAG